jgi:hypothetical protein
MKCYECGGTYIKKQGDLQTTDRYIGPFTVESISYFKCDSCGNYLFSPEASKQIEHARLQILDKILQALPLSHFAPATEVAQMLNISRQALHKNRRIRQGFIFQTRFGDKMVYLRESVLLFKVSGDGRFPLWSYHGQIQYTETETVTPSPVQYKEFRLETVQPLFGKTHETKPLRRYYNA